MQQQGIFIAATGQNVGKTTLCLGIIAGLQKRFKSVGFIKPVGQQHVRINQQTTVDKDAVLFKKHFKIKTDWTDISPVIIPQGFTKDFIDGKISEEVLLEKILDAYKKIVVAHDYTVVEGTGHVGVGSIVNLNNAKVAATLGLDMVIIASGGLGSAHDELALNFAMCEKYGVNVRGVILNRVHEEKKAMIQDYFSRALKKWNIPLIGTIPYNAFLSLPTIRDFEVLFDTSLISGGGHHYRHFEHFRLVAGSLDAYKEEIIPNELIITPATREDIILATIQEHQKRKKKEGEGLSGGLILTGRHPPSGIILDEIKRNDIPTLYAPLCSYDAMKMITSYIAKIRTKDLPKIEEAIAIVQKGVNFDLLCS